MNEQKTNIEIGAEFDDGTQMLIAQTKRDIDSLWKIFDIVDEIEVPMFEGLKIEIAVFEQIEILQSVLQDLEKDL